MTPERILADKLKSMNSQICCINEKLPDLNEVIFFSYIGTNDLLPLAVPGLYGKLYIDIDTGEQWIANPTGLDPYYIPAAQGLQEVSDIGGFDNGSTLRQGTTDAGLGGNKGIALYCSVGYELKWEAGRLYVMKGDGFTIREVLYNFTNIPTATDDDTKGFVIGSRWTLDNGTTYECTDATTGTAIWALQSIEDKTDDITIDFTSGILTYTIYVSYDMEITSITNVKNSPTITMIRDGLPVSIGDFLALGDELVITVSTSSVVRLNIKKL